MSTSSVSTQDLEIIKKYTLISSGAAIIPHDLLSMGAMGLIQYRMINKIADNHGLDSAGRQSVLLMASAVASGITALMDQLLTQAADSVPGSNLIAKSITGAALTSLVTTYVGMTFSALFERGVDFDRLDVAEFWSELRNQARGTDLENNLIDDVVAAIA